MRGYDGLIVGCMSQVDLRFVLFQNVQTLTLFVPENVGNAEQTVISKLMFIGTPIIQEGAKRSEADQAAASKADWLGRGIA